MDLGMFFKIVQAVALCVSCYYLVILIKDKRAIRKWNKRK